MWLIPGALAVLLLGLSIAGPAPAAALAWLLGVSYPLALVLIYALFLAAGVGLAWAARSYVYEGHDAHEDAPWETGLGRGQRPLEVLLTAALIFIIAAIVLLSPASGLHLGLTAIVALVAFVPVPLAPAKRWPPALPAYQVPAPLEFPSEAEESPSAPADIVQRHFTWRFDNSLAALGSGAHFSLALGIRQSAYEHFKRREHSEPATDPAGFAVLGRYVSAGDAPELQDCARQLAQKALDLKLGYFDLINFVTSFTTGSMRYAHDDAAHGRPQYTSFPLETLFEQQGDCEDFAVLAAALLRLLGVDVMLFVVQFDKGPAHAAIGVRSVLEVPGLRPPLEFEGKRYYYCEATPSGAWRFGEFPAEFAAPKKIIPIPLPPAQ